MPSPQATATDWVNMVNEFQKGSLSTRLKIPMIYGIDAIHGNNNVFNATIFPHNVGLGATRHVIKRFLFFFRHFERNEMHLMRQEGLTFSENF